MRADFGDLYQGYLEEKVGLRMLVTKEHPPGRTGPWAKVNWDLARNPLKSSTKEAAYRDAALTKYEEQETLRAAAVGEFLDEASWDLVESAFLESWCDRWNGKRAPRLEIGPSIKAPYPEALRLLSERERYPVALVHSAARENDGHATGFYKASAQMPALFFDPVKSVYEQQDEKTLDEVAAWIIQHTAFYSNDYDRAYSYPVRRRS